MPEAIELIGLLTTRCFCVVQKQKGVADAMIEAEITAPHIGLPRLDFHLALPHTHLQIQR